MPKQLYVRNTTRDVTIVEHGRFADDIWHKFIGLMGVRELKGGDGLLLRGEQAIHTFGMRIPIDVAYLDAHGFIIHAAHSMPPGRIGPFVWKARNILELPAGFIALTGTREGDQLEIGVR